MHAGCGVYLLTFNDLYDYHTILIRALGDWSQQIRTETMRQSCSFSAVTARFFSYSAKPFRVKPKTYCSARKCENTLAVQTISEFIICNWTGEKHEAPKLLSRLSNKLLCDRCKVCRGKKPQTKASWVFFVSKS